MVTLGDIFRQHGPAYRAQYGERMPLSHRRAMRAIEQCRTPALGGHVYFVSSVTPTITTITRAAIATARSAKRSRDNSGW